jgi:hypothetical protein
MNYNQFSNLSCYEEFEIQCALMGISKIDVLKEFGHKIKNYYFCVLTNGVFNWFDLKGNYVEDPGILKEIIDSHIPTNIINCIIPNSVTSIDCRAFLWCCVLKEITIPNNVMHIGKDAFYYCESLKEVVFKGKTLEEVKQMNNYPFGIKDKSIIKVSEI